MDYLDTLRVFRPFYGKNQKYYAEIHPLLYYNDEIFTNPFLKVTDVKEEIDLKKVSKHIKNYKVGFKRSNFLKLFLRILKENNFSLSYDEVLRQMIYDFDSLNLFKEYNLREYKYSRSDIRNIILNKEVDRFEFIQFCADYFSFVIHLITDEMYTFYPRNDKKILAPKVFIFQDIIRQEYIHIRVNDKIWLEQQKIEKEISPPQPQQQQQQQQSTEENTKPTYDCSKLTKMKLKELQTIAGKLGIDIQKLNERKTRMINKKKSELISEITEKN